MGFAARQGRLQSSRSICATLLVVPGLFYGAWNGLERREALFQPRSARWLGCLCFSLLFT